ncbi:hypothetical protein, partial [Salmonella enterica]|uniref:hypothetical protein n=1 Tax=Salmonella enterica TaxID=28901 RepID=UPI00329A5066
MKKTTWFAGRFPGYVSPLNGVAVSVLAALCPLTCRGESYFNPAFLTADTASEEDLTRLGKGYHQHTRFVRV